MILFSQTTFVMPHEVVFIKKFTAFHMSVRSPHISGREIW